MSIPLLTAEGDLTAVPHANDNSQLLELAKAIGKAEATGSYPYGNSPLGDFQRMPSANDNRHKPLLIGITGKRNVGKSTVATLLEQRYGFSRAHAFDGGKEAARAYFEHITGNYEIADSMVYGSLKDTQSHYLPGNVAPRFFLEKFGHFMGHDLGVEWTLAMEIARLRRESPRSPIVVESLVYEAPWFKAEGGLILRLERPDFDGPAGVASDSVQAAIEADYTIRATNVADLERHASWWVDSLQPLWRAA